jgi:hypothetical protein
MSAHLQWRLKLFLHYRGHRSIETRKIQTALIKFTETPQKKILKGRERKMRRKSKMFLENSGSRTKTQNKRLRPARGR